MAPLSSAVSNRSSQVLAATLCGGLLVGAAIPFVNPKLVLAGLLAGLIVAVVAIYPAFGAYLLIGVTPLIAGIDRGTVIPVLRPNEALLGLVATGLISRCVFMARTGSLRWPKMDARSLSIVLMAVAASILPLLWMRFRGQQIESDDILYALLPWKYFGLYLVIRASVKTEEEVRVCLWISMWSAAAVSLLAIMQSLGVGPVTHFLTAYYTDYGYAAQVSNGRGGSTLSLPIAVADLMTFNLAIAVGFARHETRRRGLLIGLGMLFVAGVLAAAEFSGAIGLIIGVVIMAAALRRLRPLAVFLPAFALSAVGLRPVIATRLSGFQSVSGIPVSWAGRWYNLTNYFWPVLFSHGNYILGVRPAARVVSLHRAAGYVWIESGYTWLLWGGGIPLLASFLWFLYLNIARGLRVVRTRLDSIGVAALASVVALGVVGCLMVLDPHLTYRGSADLLFMLLALAALGDVESNRGVANEQANVVRGRG
ncbi:MAG TPA: hypothetical protein VEM41_00200 [Actinomycetota bacterium]|nr:hypothetical protein [Actinomycetota bacterium]